MIFLAVILFVALLLFAPFCFHQFKVIFFPTPKDHLKYLKDFIVLKEKDVVYDLGSGAGDVLAYLVSGTVATGVGVELSPLMYLIGKLRSSKNEKIRIIWGDFLKTDLGQATLVYCFLNPKVLEKLIPKFRKELKPGTRLISYLCKSNNFEPSH